MKLIVSLLFCYVITLLQPLNLVTAQDLALRAKVYPGNTLAVVTCNDISSFITAFYASDIGRRFAGLPSVRLVNKVIELDDSRWKAGRATDKDEPAPATEMMEWVEWLGECFEDQPCELALIEVENKFNWLFAVGCDTDHPGVLEILDWIRRTNRLGFLSVEFVDKEQTVFSVARLGLHIKVGDGFLVMSNSASVAIDWDFENGIVVGEKTLANKRLFKSCNANLDWNDDAATPRVQGFVNFYRCLELYSNEESGESVKKLIRELGGNDILGTTFEFCFAPTPEIDFEYQVYVQQGIPRTGLNGLIHLHELQQPVSEDVPASVTYYARGSLDLISLFESINALDKVISKQRNRKYLSMQLQRTSSLLGLMLFDGGFEFESLRKVEIEQFGQILDSSEMKLDESSTRLFAQDKRVKDLWFHLIQQGSLKMKETKIGDGRILSLAIPPKDWVQHGDKTYSIYPYDPAYSVEPNGIGRYGSVSMCESVLMNNAEVYLVDTDDFQQTWEYLSTDQTPCVFIWFRDGWVLRPLYYYIKRMHSLGVSYLKAETHDSSEFESHGIVEEYKKWDFSNFGKDLSCGGVGIYQKDNGLLLRCMQFREDTK